MSCVTSVPSERWNSRVIRSSVTLDEIVSRRISPPYNLQENFINNINNKIIYKLRICLCEKNIWYLGQRLY